MAKQIITNIKYLFGYELTESFLLYGAIILIMGFFSWIFSLGSGIASIGFLGLIFLTMIVNISVNNLIHNYAITFSVTRRSLFASELIFKFLYSILFALVIFLLFGVDKLLLAADGTVSFFLAKNIFLMFFFILLLYSFNEIIAIFAFRFGKVVMTVVMMLFGGVCGGLFSFFINGPSEILPILLNEIPAQFIVIAAICTTAVSTLVNFFANRKYCAR